MRFTPLGLAVLLTAAALGQDPAPVTPPQPDLVITSADGMGEVELDRKTNIATARAGVVVRYGTAVLTAQQIRLSPDTTVIEAEGDVSIKETRPDGGTVLWRGNLVRYDYVHRTIEADEFRFGQPPYFAAGQQLRAGETNTVQTALQAVVTTDDVEDPAYQVRARSITVTNNKTVTAEDATAFIGRIPIMYFPRYSQTLGERRFYWKALPGYRNAWGAFVLGAYHQNWNETVQTAIALDYYTKRGPGVGPAVSYDLGKWGQGRAQFYYVHDREPGSDFFGRSISENRERVTFSHLANPWEDFYARAAVRYQADANIIHDFFEDEYRANTQPLTYFEGQQLWKNFTLGALVTPQVNSFQQQVERLPEVMLNGARQKLGPTPFFYESQSTAGYLEFRGGDYTSTNYSAFRADTFHQLTLPYTALGWLNLVPRVGGRFTHYSDPSGLDLEAEDRWVFNTGGEVSAKASALWKGVSNRALELDGLRHIIQPSVNYTYVPTPTVRPYELPQFDRRVPSLELEPVDFPDNNSIDSLDYRNVVRLSLFNLLQTKRGGTVQPFASWLLYNDWNVGDLKGEDQTRFSDVYSRIMIQPRTWIGYGTLLRYDVEDSRVAEFDNLIRLTPNDVWSWAVGNRYLVADPQLGMLDSSLFFSSLAYRMNENWSVRMTHQYEARTDTMQAQYYTLARDFRAWVGAITIRIRDNGPNGMDWTVGVAFQLKAAATKGVQGPDFGPSRLLGYWN